MKNTYEKYLVSEKREFDKMGKVKDKVAIDKIKKTIKSIKPNDPKAQDHLKAVRRMIEAWYQKFWKDTGLDVEVIMMHGDIPKQFKQEWDKKELEISRAKSK